MSPKRIEAVNSPKPAIPQSMYSIKAAAGHGCIRLKQSPYQPQARGLSTQQERKRLLKPLRVIPQAVSGHPLRCALRKLAESPQRPCFVYNLLPGHKVVLHYDP